MEYSLEDLGQGSILPQSPGQRSLIPQANISLVMEYAYFTLA